MKISAAFLVVLALARTFEVSGVPLSHTHRDSLSSSNLKDDLNDFLALVPRDKIVDLFYQYLEEDEDFGEALDYVMSDEFKSLLSEIESLPEIRELINFLQASGLDAYGFLNNIHNLLGMENIQQRKAFRFTRITGGLPGFIEDVKALLPIEQIKKLYHEKLETSVEFKTLITRLESKEFQGLVDTLMANPKLQDLIKRAEAKGVDVRAILDFLSTLLGWKFPSRSVFFLNRNLKDDLNDFLALVPREKIVDLFYQYLEEDEDFGETLDYVMSDEFRSLLSEIESLSEIRDLINFLQGSDLDAYGFLNHIHDLLGMEHIQRKAGRFTRITGGLPGFIEDVKALLPIEQIKKLYHEKLETSVEFKTLITRLESEEFQGLVDKVMANPKLQNLIKRAEAKGVDVRAILDFLSTLLGWKFPSRSVFFLNRNLKDDLYDFLALVPREKIVDLFYQYLEEDEDFGETLDYVMSDEFKSLLTEMESLPENREFINFLQASGLDAYGFLNKIHDLLGMEHIQQRKAFSFTRITGGLPGFIEDVKALLPIEQIKKLYHEKLETSVEFKTLITRLESEEFQGLVDKVMANPKLQELIKRAEAKGVDIQAILDFLSTLLGWKFPSRPIYLRADDEEVIEILRHIWSKVDTEGIFNIVLDYLVCDQDFKKVVKFMLTDEFKQILLDIEEIKEMKELFEFLNDTGINVYKGIDELHDILGIEKRLPLPRLECNITGGVRGLIHDIWALIPREELRAYFWEKRQTNKKFDHFVTQLETQELQNAINALNENVGFNLLLVKLEGLGVDFNKVIEIILAVIGVKFPERPPSPF